MRSDVKQLVQNQFWTRQMLEFIHPRYSLSKYERKYGSCQKHANELQKSRCIQEEQTKINDLMIFAEYFKNKNTKCIEEGVTSGYDWKYVQKYCWSKVIAVMEKTYPMSEEQKQHVAKVEVQK